MPQHLHSVINLSGTRASVLDPIAGQHIADVRKREGFWEARCAMTGSLLLPRIEHRIEHAPKKAAFGAPKIVTEVTLGQILRNLRGVLCA